jgi:hypothetical protein
MISNSLWLGAVESKEYDRHHEALFEALSRSCSQAAVMHGRCCCCADHCYATATTAAIVPVIVALPNYDYTAGLPGQYINYYDTTPWRNSARGRYREDQVPKKNIYIYI